MTVRETPPQPPARASRRYDLDWLRVAAFGLLILYHVALVYSPFDWHIRSHHTAPWVREALLVSSPWRLTLLFLVSGAALSFLCRNRTTGQILQARFSRLAPPLIFGVLVLVPIQSWIEATDKGFWTQGYVSWLASEFSPGGIANGVPVNHLWFLVYISAYSLAAVLLMQPQLVAALAPRLERALRGWRVLAWPIVYLIAIRILIFPWFGVTNRLSADWYNHALSFGAFLFGFLVVGREGVWRDLERLRFLSLTIGLTALPVVMIQDIHPGGGAWHGVPRAAVFALEQGAMIAAILGFASRHLRDAGGPVLSYLNEAIFPLYLAHQTVLVAAAWMLKPTGLPAAVEAFLLVAATVVGSLAIYEAVRRVAFLRPLWGLKPYGAETSPFVRRRRLLAFGVAGPVVALLTVVTAIAAYPGYNHATQYLSELGGASARDPAIFNTGVLAAGLMAGLAGAGFGLAIVALTNARLIGLLTAVVFGAAGVGLSAAAIYPWPDPRHMAINLGLGIQIAPLLLLWGLWRRRDLKRLKLFLGAIFIIMALLTLLTKHLLFPGTVTDANVGWWERAYAIVLVGWVAVAAIVLDRRLGAEAPPDVIHAENAHGARTKV